MPVAPGTPIPQVTYCDRCRRELTAITRCEKDGHRTHHDHCCPGNNNNKKKK